MQDLKPSRVCYVREVSSLVVWWPRNKVQAVDWLVSGADRLLDSMKIRPVQGLDISVSAVLSVESCSMMARGKGGV